MKNILFGIFWFCFFSNLFWGLKTFQFHIPLRGIVISVFLHKIAWLWLNSDFRCFFQGRGYVSKVNELIWSLVSTKFVQIFKNILKFSSIFILSKSTEFYIFQFSQLLQFFFYNFCRFSNFHLFRIFFFNFFKICILKYLHFPIFSNHLIIFFFFKLLHIFTYSNRRHLCKIEKQNV